MFWWLHDTQGPQAAARWTHAAFVARFTRGMLLNDAAGVFVAPVFKVDGEPFWGKDRMRQPER